MYIYYVVICGWVIVCVYHAVFCELLYWCGMVCACDHVVYHVCCLGVCVTCCVLYMWLCLCLYDGV